MGIDPCADSVNVKCKQAQIALRSIDKQNKKGDDTKIMANADFNNIDEFIDGFTKTNPLRKNPL